MSVQDDFVKKCKRILTLCCKEFIYNYALFIRHRSFCVFIPKMSVNCVHIKNSVWFLNQVHIKDIRQTIYEMKGVKLILVLTICK